MLAVLNWWPMNVVENLRKGGLLDSVCPSFITVYCSAESQKGVDDAGGWNWGEGGGRWCTGRSGWAREGSREGGSINIKLTATALDAYKYQETCYRSRRDFGLVKWWDMLWATDVRTTARCWTGASDGEEL